MSLPTDHLEANKIIKAALDNGITYFDTADLYNNGENEQMIGNALKDKRQDSYFSYQSWESNE